MGILAYLDICIGHSDQHALAQASYDATVSLLTKNAAIYGLPSSPSALSEEQQEILKELDVLSPPLPRRRPPLPPASFVCVPPPANSGLACPKPTNPSRASSRPQPSYVVRTLRSNDSALSLTPHPFCRIMRSRGSAPASSPCCACTRSISSRSSFR